MVDVFPTIAGVNGYRVAGVHCGIKKNNALDFALILSDKLATCAGVFTTNLVKAAPVLVDQDKLKRTGGRVRALAINSGCANAATGQQGLDNAYETARYIATKIGCHEDEVLVMSTGVIGVQLPMDKIQHGVDLAVEQLTKSAWDDVARAIMTTDTRPKLASTNADGFQIAGIAKGAGMIAPNMATMLSFIVTDANLSLEDAQGMLDHASNRTYNRIVIDGDMSTNDTVLLLANGDKMPAHDIAPLLEAVSKKLAQDIVRDGEGVTKFVAVTVNGTATDADARHIANTIATSPLVKTAFYGNDANWGRIIAAAGRAGIDFDVNKMQLEIGRGVDTVHGESITLVMEGTPCVYSEAEATAIVSETQFTYSLNLGTGRGTATVWTCDLSHDYISINAEYRT